MAARRRWSRQIGLKVSRVTVRRVEVDLGDPRQEALGTTAIAGYAHVQGGSWWCRVLSVAGAIALLDALAGLYPAVRAARLAPAAALRSV